MARPEITVLGVSPSGWPHANWFPVDGIQPREVGTERFRIDDQQHKVDIGVRCRRATSPRTDQRNGANCVVRRRPGNDSLNDTFGSLDKISHL